MTPYLVLAGLGLFVLTGVVVWVALAAAHSVGEGPNPPTNFAGLLVEVASGQRPWPGPTATKVAVGEVAGLAGLAVLAWRVIPALSRSRTRIDVASRHLASRRDLEHLSEGGAASTAARLGAKTTSPGVRVGEVVGSGKPLFGSWEDMHVDIWGPRTGKALAQDTPALTPHGWVPIKDLARGCRVIGSDGRPTMVTGVFPQGVRPAYRMRFSDGTSALCDTEHLWTVRVRPQAGAERAEEWRTCTTSQLVEFRRVRTHVSYDLPIVAPVHFEGMLPEGPDLLPIDPYLLGILLSVAQPDGGRIRLSADDLDALLPLLEPLLPAGVIAKPIKDSVDWILTSPLGASSTDLLRQALNRLGILGPTGQVLIPEMYLLADLGQREALLQGLLDAAGSVVERKVGYATTSSLLAEGVRFLARSLGCVVTGEDDHEPYRLELCLAAGCRPFRLEVKAKQWAEVGEQAPVRTITAIEPEEATEMVCISVQASDGLFVIQDFVVTHNTTSRAIPAILEAPGAVLVTSNKRDIVDGTRLPRERLGEVWVFDPQKVAEEPPTWWWNPLTYVTDVDYATRLAGVFGAYARDPGAKSDGYFEPEGEALLAFLLLAAAEAGEPITTVYRWLSDHTDSTAVDILRKAGHELPAEHVQGVINYPDKQRGGIYGTARKSVNCLVNPAVTRWVTPGKGREFRPDDFVRSDGTLYSLSREGQGTAGPLVTALTVATIEAAERKATASPSGRLPVPMLGVLDEAANVCRWRDLPDLYSHYGSRGIVLMTILQSWAQGVEVWGEQGIAKLWSAANIRVYGGGVSDPRFLGDLVQLIGEYEPLTYSTTAQSGPGQRSRSVSTSTRQEKILDVADLFSMPRGRALVLPSGSPPVLVKTLPWHTGPYAQAVKDSLAKYAPAN